jgi:hypothetical protein
MKKYTKIICVLDRSGSMSTILDDAIGGFNQFLTDQQNFKEDEAVMSTLLFDDEFQYIYKNLDIQQVEPFNRETYVPRSMTALYDAVGLVINDEIDWLGNCPPAERPSKTLCVILTDGAENSSHKFNKEKIKALIDEMKEDYQWEFIFLAANQDAALSAEGMGISRGNSMTFDYSGDGVNEAYATLSKATFNYRSAEAKADTSNLIED